MMMIMMLVIMIMMIMFEISLSASTGSDFSEASNMTTYDLTIQSKYIFTTDYMIKTDGENLGREKNAGSAEVDLDCSQVSSVHGTPVKNRYL